MILEKIIPINFGPFSANATLDIEPNTTVLTGSNDVGKSLILKLMNLILSPPNGASCVESDVNKEYLFKSTEWKKDTNIGCKAIFKLVKSYKELKENDRIHIFFNLSPEKKIRRIEKVIRGNNSVDIRVRVQNEVLNKLPEPLFIDDRQQIRIPIPLQNPSLTEQDFLKIAFGQEFSIDRINGFSAANYASYLNRGKENLNSKAKEVLPDSLKIEFDLMQVPGQPRNSLIVNIIDRYKGHIPLNERGSGLKKIVTLLSRLLNVIPSNKSIFIIMDEPENSLHADSQRSLRTLIEKLTENPQIQLIYATHSPTMINTMKPESMRLIKREKGKNGAVSVVENKPIDNNYLPVRSSLGLVPSDSLLYSDISIIVEGATEIRCLPELLKKLNNEKLTDFENILTLMSQVHFINGMGDNFKKLCKIAIAQGSKPIIFIDGDKIREIRKLKIHEEFPQVPIIHLPDGQEFENIVPLEIYLKAVGKFHQLDENKTSIELFNKWVSENSLHEKMLLSKKVDAWLKSEFDCNLNKPFVMKLAIDIYNISENFNINPFRELCDSILKLMGNSFDGFEV